MNKKEYMSAADMLMQHSQVSDANFEKRPVGLTGKFSSLCDGNCEGGNCGQCN